MLASVVASQACSPPARRPSPPTPPAPSHEWHPATYGGLTMRQSTHRDMLRAFGEPDWTEPSEDQDEDEPNKLIWNVYEKGRGPLSGQLTVNIEESTDLVVSIQVIPEALSMEGVIQRFGTSSVIGRYEFCEGFKHEYVTPIYADPKGKLECFEYAEQGVVIWDNGKGKIEHVDLVARPDAFSTKEECRLELKRLRKNRREAPPWFQKWPSAANARCSVGSST